MEDIDPIETMSPHQESDAASSPEGAAPSSSLRWYVLRYKNLTTSVRDYLRRASVEVFLPVSHVRKTTRRGASPKYVESPLIRGYVFVCCSLDKALEVSRDTELPLWRRRSSSADGESILHEEDFYVTISDADMRPFIQAVDLKAQDIEFFDADYIDVEQDDEVLVIDGEFRGTRGYLKTVKGKGGGIVIVPLRSDDGKDVNLCYPLELPACQIGITAFAPGNRHSVDSLRNARIHVDAAYEAYVGGEELTTGQRERLLSYSLRYGQLRLATDIQRANLQMLLLRIFTVLELDTQRDSVLRVIEEQILPAFDRRIATARQKYLSEAEQAREAYLGQMAAAAGARQQRRQALNMTAGTRQKGSQKSKPQL